MYYVYVYFKSLTDIGDLKKYKTKLYEYLVNKTYYSIDDFLGDKCNKIP